ncbi:MAG TPA: glycosyltransferase [Armatimonadota bacterium]|jgi:glycosyltransferase involved in cell wall biosynthesis
MTQHEFDISVCLCTHNPRREYLTRVLAALAGQSLDPERWELIVVDNKSEESVAQWADLSGIRHARVISEPKLGLTNARVAAIHAADGEVLVFVDDDNVLAADYLECACTVMAEKEFLGAIGGKCKGEFEVDPPTWTHHYLQYLAVADHGNQPLFIHHKNTYLPWYPYGAGLVIRRELARIYVHQLENDPERRKLDRRGNSLTSAGDIDMVLTIMDEGHGIGFFPQLSLKHIIPRQRLSFSYLKRLIYHSNYSLYHLMLSRHIAFHPRPWPLTYITSVLLCLMHRKWHPLTLMLACQAARGRYAALHDHNQSVAARKTMLERSESL